MGDYGHWGARTYGNDEGFEQAKNECDNEQSCIAIMVNDSGYVQFFCTQECNLCDIEGRGTMLKDEVKGTGGVTDHKCYVKVEDPVEAPVEDLPTFYKYAGFGHCRKNGILEGNYGHWGARTYGNDEGFEQAKNECD